MSDAARRYPHLVHAGEPREPDDAQPSTKPKGGGTYDGMDGWQQSVETRLSELRQDVRDLRGAIDRNFILTWSGLIGMFLALTGIMAKGFEWF